MLTSSSGHVHQRAVAKIQGFVEDEIRAGTYRSPVDPATLGYAIVRLAEAFLFNDETAAMRGDVERLREIEAALLGVPA
jgi:tetracycline repressor-like protein